MIGFLNFLIDLFGFGSSNSDRSFDALAQGGAMEDSIVPSNNVTPVILAIEEELEMRRSFEVPKDNKRQRE